MSGFDAASRCVLSSREVGPANRCGDRTHTPTLLDEATKVLEAKASGARRNIASSAADDAPNLKRIRAARSTVGDI